MGGFMFGADTGQISGFLIMKDYLRRFANDRGNGIYKFNNVREGLIVGLISIGALFGALIAAPLSNKYGRRTVMIAAAIVFWVGNTVQITAQWAWYQIMIGRFISGLGIGSLSG
jgi:MFS transporter, SP family, sugar:H+ symporter